MRRLLPLTLLLTLCLAASAQAKPNVLVVMTDDMSYDNLKFMPKTNAFFKKNGTSFTRNYVSFPLCCPARATFLTGQLAHNHGVQSVFSPENYIGWTTKENNLGSWMQKAGYKTGLSGKYLNGYGERDQYEVPKGWDDWHGSIDETTIDAFNVRLNHNGKVQSYGDADWVNRTFAFSEIVGKGDVILDYPGLVQQIGIHFLSRPQPWTFGTTEKKNYTTFVEGKYARTFMKANKKKSWFSWYTPPSQHREDVAEQANLGRPIGINPRVPEPYLSRVKNLTLPRGPAFAEQDVSDKRADLQPQPPHDGKPYLMANTLSPDCVYCLQKLTDYYRGRAGASMALDDEMGRIFSDLKKTGQLKKTVIVFTSDNGWLLGQHNLNGNKFLPYEESSRVPLMMAGPGVPRGKTVSSLVSNVDLNPTIVKLSGAKADRESDGVSLIDVARGKVQRSAVPLEATRKLIVKPGNFPNQEDVPYYGVRTKDFMYAHYTMTDEVELYDMKKDPYQMENVAYDPAYAQKTAEMEALALSLSRCKGGACVR